MASEVLKLCNLSFSYAKGPEVLQISSFEVPRNQKLFIYGPSGCGKSTLLGLITGVLSPQKGSVEVLGTALSSLSGGAKDRFRGENLGYIFQIFNLIPYLSVLENILLPCELHAKRRQRIQGDPREKARELAAHLGIENLLDKKVNELSVGQQQRAAAARALLGHPDLLIADEPTSALDFDHKERFLKLLFDECDRAGSSLIFVSHDRDLKKFFDQSVSLPELNTAGRS